MSEKFSLKYLNNAPEGYEISKIQYTFDFIYLVFKRDASIEKAIEGVAFEYGLSEDYLRDYLIENRYIINKENKNELSKQIKQYNTKSLKKILRKHGLKTSGKRRRIERRIFENRLFEIDYYLSSKSKTFYKNKQRRIRIFNEYLSDDYYFNEFNEFYMHNYRKKEANIPVEFINLHISKAIEEKNHQSYISNSYIMSEYFSKRENYRQMLEYILKVFCMNINPIWRINELKEHTGVYMDIYDDLLLLKYELSKNIIINTFYLVWDSFDFDRIIVSKYDAYRCLNDIMNSKDYYRINADLCKRFYLNEDLKIKKITQKTLFDF